MSQFEDYLQGKPLTPELAAMKRGEDPEGAPASRASKIAVMPGGKAVARELDDNDRESLRRLKLEPGWPILLRMLDMRLQNQEDAVKRASKDSPFDGKVPGLWAEIKALEAVRLSITAMIDNEIQILEQNEAAERVPYRDYEVEAHDE